MFFAQLAFMGLFTPIVLGTHTATFGPGTCSGSTCTTPAGTSITAGYLHCDYSGCGVTVGQGASITFTNLVNIGCNKCTLAAKAEITASNSAEINSRDTLSLAADAKITAERSMFLNDATVSLGENSEIVFQKDDLESHILGYFASKGDLTTGTDSKMNIRASATYTNGPGSVSVGDGAIVTLGTSSIVRLSGLGGKKILRMGKYTSLNMQDSSSLSAPPSDSFFDISNNSSVLVGSHSHIEIGNHTHIVVNEGINFETGMHSRLTVEDDSYCIVRIDYTVPEFTNVIMSTKSPPPGVKCLPNI